MGKIFTIFAINLQSIKPSFKFLCSYSTKKTESALVYAFTSNTFSKFLQVLCVDPDLKSKTEDLKIYKLCTFPGIRFNFSVTTILSWLESNKSHAETMENGPADSPFVVVSFMHFWNNLYDKFKKAINTTISKSLTFSVLL